MQKVIHDAKILSGESQRLMDADKERGSSWLRWLFGF
jgi:hypothetical protein